MQFSKFEINFQIGMQEFTLTEENLKNMVESAITKANIEQKHGARLVFSWKLQEVSLSRAKTSKERSHSLRSPDTVYERGLFFTIWSNVSNFHAKGALKPRTSPRSGRRQRTYTESASYSVSHRRVKSNDTLPTDIMDSELIFNQRRSEIKWSFVRFVIEIKWPNWAGPS